MVKCIYNNKWDINLYYKRKKSMTRRESRIFGMQILYRIDFEDISTSDAINQVFNQTEIDETAVEFALNYLNNQEKIDTKIEDSLDNYSIDRLNAVDRAIIRLATAEMYIGGEKRVVINEALEITKQFSDEGNHKAVSFNNSLLDKIAKNI